MKPYLVPYGGSSPTGALGYAFAVKECMEQNVHADWIVFATSSGGTHAGLVLGQRVFGYKGKVLGISTDESEEWLKTHVSELTSSASEKLGKRIEFTEAEVLVNADYCAAGYGVLTESEREAIRLFAKYEGLLLDPVYTGRAAARMIDLIYTPADSRRCSRMSMPIKFDEKERLLSFLGFPRNRQADVDSSASLIPIFPKHS